MSYTYFFERFYTKHTIVIRIPVANKIKQKKIGKRTKNERNNNKKEWRTTPEAILFPPNGIVVRFVIFICILRETKMERASYEITFFYCQ